MLDNIISFDTIDTSLLKVSEKIIDKNIDKFILHNVNNQNQNIFYNYLYLSSEYFICSYNSKKSFTIIDLILVFIKDKKLDNKKVLIFYEEHFILVDNLKFYYFQKLDKELLKEDIKEYVKKRFNFDVQEEIYVNSSQLNELTINKKTTSLKFIKDTKEIKIYVGYITTLFILSFALFSFDYYIKAKKEEAKTKREKNNLLKQKSIKLEDRLSYKTSLLLSKIEKDNLQISKFGFTNKNLHITFISKNRDDVYAFLQKYKNTKVNSFLETKDGYEINSTLTFK